MKTLKTMFKNGACTLSCALHTLFFYTITCGVIVLFLIPCTIILFFPAPYRYTNRVYLFLVDLLYRAIVWSLRVPITIINKNGIPKEPAIIIANHQSSLDIPIIGSLLQRHPHLWFALAYYAHIPVFGFYIRRTGITVDRNNCGNAMRSLRTLIKTAEQCSCHVILFPEGARHNDGKVHDFYNGFAILARKTQRPVVPIYMPYNHFICPPNQLLLYGHELKVVVGPVFYSTNEETEDQFVQRVQAWFLSQEGQQ